LLCTSIVETLHLAGLEAAACNIPLLVTNVGIYHNRPSGVWGVNSSINDFKSNIKTILDNKNNFSPRKYFLEQGLDTKSCMNKWRELIHKVI